MPHFRFGSLTRRYGLPGLGTVFAAASLLLASVPAHADLLIDDFGCADSVSQTGPGFHTSGFNACSSALGGEREDFILASGPSTSVSTMNSNPPAGAITGTFGAGVYSAEGMEWSGSTTPTPQGNLPDLDFSGFDSILVRIKADTAGTVFMNFGPPLGNALVFSASFAASSTYQDVYIPLANPTISGTGSSLADVKIIGLYLGNCTDAGLACGAPIGSGGGTWSIDEVKAISTPEPASLLSMSLGLLFVLLFAARRRFARA